MKTNENIDRIFPQRDVRALPMAVMQAVMAIRLCVICHKIDRDPAAELFQRLGSESAASRFAIVFEVVGTAWPEPFTVSRPCCTMLSPDEAMFADMMITVAARDRASFDMIICDMIGTDARETLFTTLQAYDQARIQARSQFVVANH